MTNDLSLLSERERAVLRLVATGATNQQIADQLVISPNTVKVHLRNIFGKIGAASRTEATMYAVRIGLVEVAPTAAGDATPAAVATLPEERPVVPIEEAPSEELLVQPPPVVVAPIEQPAPPEPVAVPEVAPSAPLGAGRQLSHRLVGVLGVLVGILLAVGGLLLMQRVMPSEAGPQGGAPAVSIPSTSGNWVQAKAPGQALTAAAAVNYGPIFVIGGSDGKKVLGSTLRYDPLADKWSDLATKPTAVRDIAAAVLGGKIIVPGGLLADGTVSDVVELFDPQAQSWSSGPSLPAPRSGYGLAVVEGRLYLFGGWDGTSYRAEVFRLDQGAGRWDELTPMPTARAYGCVATDPQGAVFVIGGENSGGALYTNEVYLPANEGVSGARPWSQRTPLPLPRTRSGCGAVDNEIYLFGGTGEQATLRFDLRTDQWQLLSPPPAPIGAQPAVAYRDGVFYITGGGEGAPHDQLYGFRARYSVTVPVQQ